VNNKKLTALLFVSICIFNRANGMELVKDAVKNEVIPAALIMGTGAALGALSHSLIWKIHGDSDWKKHLKNGALSGLKWSLPVVGAALIGPRSSRMELSIKHHVLGSGIASIFYGGIGGCLTWINRKAYNSNMQAISALSTQNDKDNANHFLGKSVYQEATEDKIFISNAAACGFISCLLLAGRAIL
jgi:hypothetical protein